MDIKISIIIPIQNAPVGYFERCIESIFSQTFDDYEVLVIDDGSDSDFHSEYEKICCQYPRINLFYIKKSGVSAARNYGISKASGDYITFVDSDDTLEGEFLQESFNYAKKYNADFVIGKIQYFPGPEKEQGSDYIVYVDSNSISDLKKAFLGIEQETFSYYIIGSSCGRIYKRELLTDKSFPEGISLSEDQIFNREYIDKIKNAVFVPHFWYTYYQNEFSVMHDQNHLNRIEKAKPFFNYWDWLNNNENSDLKKECFIKCIDFYFAEIHTNIVPLNMPWREKRKVMREILDNDLFRDIIKNVSLNDLNRLDDKIKYLLIQNRLYVAAYGIILIKCKMTSHDKS